MKLEEMSKEEILEALDMLNEVDALDLEQIYVDRNRIVPGKDGDELWRRCQKYLMPLNNYIFRHLPPLKKLEDKE